MSYKFGSRSLRELARPALLWVCASAMIAALSGDNLKHLRSWASLTAAAVRQGCGLRDQIATSLPPFLRTLMVAGLRSVN